MIYHALITLENPFDAVFPSIFIYLLTPGSTAHAQMVNQRKLELKRIIPKVPVARSAGQSNADCGSEIGLEGFDSNLHIDTEFALRDTGCFDSKFLQIVAARK